MACGDPKCVEDAKKLALAQKGKVVKNGIIVVKTTIADVDVITDSQGRRFIKKR